jgi:CDP-diglyceride synthetase
MRALFLASLFCVAIVFSCSLILVWEVSVNEKDVRPFYPTSFVVVLVLFLSLVTAFMAFVERKTRRPIALIWYVMAAILIISFWAGLPIVMTHKAIISWQRPALAAMSNLDSSWSIR